MKNIITLIVASSAFWFSAHANAVWVKYGHWMLNEDKVMTGNGFWDKSIMFDAYSGSLPSRDKMKRELHEIKNIAGGNYRNLDSILQNSLKLADKQLNQELSNFLRTTPNRKSVKIDDYMKDKSAMQVFLYAHKTDMQVQSKVYMGFKTFDDLVNAKLSANLYINGCQQDKRTSCRDLEYKRLNDASINRVSNVLKQSYGFNLMSPPRESLYLYDNINNELSVVLYRHGRESIARILTVNLNNYSTYKAVDIKELPKL